MFIFGAFYLEFLILASSIILVLIIFNSLFLIVTL